MTAEALAQQLQARLHTSDLEIRDARRTVQCAWDDLNAALEHQRQMRAELLAVLEQAVRS